MNVASILKTKGRAVTTARPENTVGEIAAKLATKKIGAIVIVGDAGRVTGIISECDLVRVIAEHGPSALQKPASEVMTTQVVSCHEGVTVDELMDIMTTGRFRHVPVIEGGALVGLISIGDVVKYHVADMALEVTAMKNYLATG